MKKHLTPLALSLSLLGLISLSSYATLNNPDQAIKLALLEKQVSDLQKQMSHLTEKNKPQTLAQKKVVIKPLQVASRSNASRSSSSNASNLNASTNTNSTNNNTSNRRRSTSSAANYNTTSIAAGNSAIEGPTDLPSVGPMYIPLDLDVPGQSFVSSGPYIGVPFEFTGSHLIVNSPSVNEDILLLNLDKNINERLKALGRPSGQSLGSHILLSGVVEAQALTRNGGGIKNYSDIDLTSVNLDAFITGPSPWTSGFIEFSYDNNIGTQTGSFSNNDRMFNSRVYVNKAFIILGDFTRSPFYASFGQMFVPFGVYSTTMVSSPLTKILARTPARPLVIGYKSQTPNSFTATGYIFKGPTHVSSSLSQVNSGGLNFSYSYRPGHYGVVLGGGVIANIADSAGMQITGNNNNVPVLFGGFGGPTEIVPDPTVDPDNPNELVEVSSGSEYIAHRVPAYDLNAKVALGDNWQLIGEYIFSSTSFSNADLQFNDHHARPQAMNLEVVYNLGWFVNPTSISASYQMSKDALAIGLPAKRYSVAINRSTWKNTLQSLEFRRDVNYGDGDTSSGSGVIGPTGDGNSVNQITFSFDYYF